MNVNHPRTIITLKTSDRFFVTELTGEVLQRINNSEKRLETFTRWTAGGGTDSLIIAPDSVLRVERNDD